MIQLGTVIDRMRQVGLDAEGSDYYLNDIDMIPAINSAMEWLVGIISTRLGMDKFVEERLSDLHMTRIWQTNRFSRVSIDDSLGFKIWSITGIIAKPMVYVTMNGNSTLPPRYKVDIMRYLNQQHENFPIVSTKYNSPSLLLDHESTFRPELVYINGVHQASKMTHEQMGESKLNPFAPGYKRDGDFVQYGYIPFMDFSNYNPSGTQEGKYILETPKEITILPDLRRGLVAISFIRVPEEIPSDAALTYEIPMPASMLNILVEKALNYVIIKQGDGTTIYTVSEKDVIQQLG